MTFDPRLKPALKQPNENRPFNFDFTRLLPAGATIASVVGGAALQEKAGLVGGAADLTLGAPVIASPIVQVKIGGGTTGEDYKVTVRANDSLANVLEVEGVIQVREL